MSWWTAWSPRTRSTRAHEFRRIGCSPAIPYHLATCRKSRPAAHEFTAMNVRSQGGSQPRDHSVPGGCVMRLLTCGSVDDGKSTLLGRMLFDAGLVAEDQWASVERLSAQRGASGRPDYSLLLDGLLDERAQGITIDVAWRYFQTPRRKFIVADTPGHEQYTRNMVTGASQCELALLLVDARRGVTVQTRRHTGVVNLMGIAHV